ncbi:MAG: tRNA (adenosine(37)-N6)-threonylcarbamoyltransferase complex ATPase subunit type 1 TsaE [Calditrichaeota bacterium]|nr:MAG: tRNA (adenosine(37)-N6)-threonylcarbamoyltransferase complex ATPase subunit type 1 TsaE [Calditrichota bacterium]MBL1205836.1 tRNA (adenosine(37)-N6)-threonylcarbamoyltransferase complex ATPase subunit type 1 TsaE [Calditrichota bacterium]NOG45663.1 tRNA (adenosine(37)-N6)-threonylcarbamoyltransferase complex ATPase subunit type 1 TsaE [Calditrichota bacterium]
MKLLKSWTVNSISDSQKIAVELSNIFKAADVVLLEGTLGSGKTFLVQEICKNWHIDEDVTSPTFTLIQNYFGDIAVNHLDLYRIENIEELDQLGWEDMVYSEAVTFIEWPQKVEPALQSFYKVKIDLRNDQREISLNKKN